MAHSSRTLTWLHLSDLHRCSARDGGAGEVVLRRLLDDLRALRDEHGLRPDLLFMTGDLAFGQIREQPLDEQLREGWRWLEKVRRLYDPEIGDLLRLERYRFWRQRRSQPSCRLCHGGDQRGHKRCRELAGSVDLASCAV